MMAWNGGEFSKLPEFPELSALSPEASGMPADVADVRSTRRTYNSHLSRIDVGTFEELVKGVGDFCGGLSSSRR
jgi:hypothetical protein